MISSKPPENVISATCRICGEVFTETVELPPEKVRAEKSRFVREVATNHAHDEMDYWIVSVRQS